MNPARSSDADRVAFILAHTPPGFRPDFERLAAKMVRAGQSNRHPSDLALTLQLSWHRARRKAMTTPN